MCDFSTAILSVILVVLLEWTYSEEALLEAHNPFDRRPSPGNSRKIRHLTFQRASANRERVFDGLSALSRINH